MVRRFKKKPLVIEAIQWSGNVNKAEIEEFVGSSIPMKEKVVEQD